MKKEVIISIKGSQTVDSVKDDYIELITEGKYYQKDGLHYLVYKETKETGIENSTTTLKTDGKEVTLLRTGENNSQLVFRKGQPYTGHYETKFGSFTVGVLPKEVEVSINGGKGDIRVNYSIAFTQNETVYNDFKVNFFEKQI